MADDLEDLALDLQKAGVFASVRAGKIMRKHADQMNEGIKQGAPSRRVGESSTVTESDDGLSVTFGPRSPLALLFEYGTAPRFHRSGRYTGVMSPQSFVEPVVGPGIEAMVSEIEAKIGQEL